MQHYNLDDLIDGFLKQKLNSSESEALQKLISSDARIAEKVEESAETFRFLQYLRYRQIKKQLQDLDESEKRTRKRLDMRRWAIIMMVSVIAIIASWNFLASHYKPENVARRNFEPIVFNGAVPTGYSADDTLHLFNAYHLATKRDYQNASGLWHPYAEDGSYQLVAKWNVLMCHLAMQGPDPGWQRNMTGFLAIEGNPFLSKGEKLLKLVNSSFYKILTGNSSTAISALKPRLI